MDVAVWGAIAKVAKKILEVLIGDKNGRKFLGYVVGIALFVVLLPVIVLLGLFGWMAGDGGASLINYDVIYSQMPSEYRAEHSVSIYTPRRYSSSRTESVQMLIASP